MATDNFVKAYAVIKSQWLSCDRLDDYFYFVATIINEVGMDVINEHVICQKLEEKYSICFQPTFVRQIISNAIKKGVIQNVREQYIVNKEAIKKYCISDKTFDKNWSYLITDFITYSESAGYTIEYEHAEKCILDFIDAYDDHVIFNNMGDIDVSESPFLYHWCKYILQLVDSNFSLYSFVVDVCSANLFKTTLFYSSQGEAAPVELKVFFDTPMIFSILGIDTQERKDAYCYIAQKAISCGMTVHIFDHNLTEVLGIMERSAKWARSSEYRVEKASRVAQFFHDSEMSEEDITEFIGSVEAVLNGFGITKEVSDYDYEEDEFQEDEEELFSAIKSEYGEQKLKFMTEDTYNNSIRIDVRSMSK